MKIYAYPIALLLALILAFVLYFHPYWRKNKTPARRISAIGVFLAELCTIAFAFVAYLNHW